MERVCVGFIDIKVLSYDREAEDERASYSKSIRPYARETVYMATCDKKYLVA